jgi:hypothetical protein
MKNICRILLAATIACFSSGCLYANVKAPLDTDVSNTELGNKVGRSSAQSILWLVAWGDAGTEAAAREGNINVIKHMDEEALVVLFGAYAKKTTIVYGD